MDPEIVGTMLLTLNIALLGVFLAVVRIRPASNNSNIGAASSTSAVATNSDANLGQSDPEERRIVMDVGLGMGWKRGGANVEHPLDIDEILPGKQVSSWG